MYISVYIYTKKMYTIFELNKDSEITEKRDKIYSYID